MEQYKLEGQPDTLVNPIKASDESKQIRSVESLVKQLQDTVNLQQHEITKLHRDIIRLKGDISDIVTALRNRG